MGEKYTAFVNRAGRVGLMEEIYTEFVYTAGTVGLIGEK
jgi:hypothetical protein